MMFYGYLRYSVPCTVPKSSRVVARTKARLPHVQCDILRQRGRLRAVISDSAWTTSASVPGYFGPLLCIPFPVV